MERKCLDKNLELLLTVFILAGILLIASHWGMR